jgi:hypothetical protein
MKLTIEQEKDPGQVKYTVTMNTARVFVKLVKRDFETSYYYTCLRSGTQEVNCFESAKDWTLALKAGSLLKLKASSLGRPLTDDELDEFRRYAVNQIRADSYHQLCCESAGKVVIGRFIWLN